MDLYYQKGKFEHGFLSGFVSSLGGSFMQSGGVNMSGAGKIVVSAAIGGTAEALGGGKPCDTGRQAARRSLCGGGKEAQ